MRHLIAAACIVVVMLSFGNAITGCAQAVAASATKTAAWNAPTANDDGSAITASITYNVYAGAPGKEVIFKTAVAALTLPVTFTVGGAQCVEITTVVDGIESMRTPEVCVTLPFSTPNAPTGVTLK